MARDTLSAAGRPRRPTVRRALSVAAFALIAGVAVLAILQRRLMYFPARLPVAAAERMAADVGAEAWETGGTVHGWRFPRPGARAVLMAFHGNAGMALDRRYMAQALGAAADTAGPAGSFEVRVVEYPGFGARPGDPGEAGFFAAAEAAFDAASAETRGAARPVFVLGESIGTGPACHLAAVRGERVAGLILVTPFDRLSGPAGHHFPWLPVSLFLRDRFENDRALERWRGRVAVLLAGRDTVVPPEFGQRLYDGYAGPKRLWVDPVADHNELPWDRQASIWREIAAFVRGE